MKVTDFIEVIGADFYTGIPDSQLKPLCNYLMHTYGIDAQHHVIAANEGACAAMAAGYYFATGKIPVVYMQNSGEGNIINPVASLLNDKVYAVPMIFVIGWRGEPGVKDEPQHIYQGEVTLQLLSDMDISYYVLSKETTVEELKTQFESFSNKLKTGKNVAFVIKKNALSYDISVEYTNNYIMNRECIIQHILLLAGDQPIISTTGKASRELFELREQATQNHSRDFLTVGSMGHASSIALGIALQKPNKKVWCIDGDGAFLMHMGSAAVIGSLAPKNFVHLVINNEAHETVGGLPTVSGSIDFVRLAEACGYSYAVSVDCEEELDKALAYVSEYSGLSLIEIKTAIGSRSDLGRPTTTPRQNKESFMRFLSE